MLSVVDVKNALVVTWVGAVLRRKANQTFKIVRLHVKAGKPVAETVLLK